MFICAPAMLAKQVLFSVVSVGLCVLVSVCLFLRQKVKNYYAAACFYHIRRLRQVRRRIGQEVTQQLVLALDWTTVTACWQDCQRPRCSHYSASRMQLLDWCSA